jgi:hypothetical protein
MTETALSRQGYSRQDAPQTLKGQRAASLPLLAGKVGMGGKGGTFPPTCVLPHQGGGEEKGF